MARAKTPDNPAPSTPPPAPAAPMPWASPGSLDQAGQRAYLAGERAHYLVQHPGVWMALDGWCVPDLRPLYAGEAGVAGVEARRQGVGRDARWVADPETAIVRAQRRGCRVLPHACDADQGHASYLVPVPGTGTWAHRLQPLVPGMEPQEAPAADYAAWLRDLMDRGLLDKPHPAEVRAVGERLLRIMQTHQGSKSEAQADALRRQWELYQKRALTHQVGAANAAA